MNPQYTTYILIGVSLLCTAILLAIIYRKNKKAPQAHADPAIKLPKPFALEQKDTRVFLRCGDLKQAFLIVGIAFNLITVTMLILLSYRLHLFEGFPYSKIAGAIFRKEIMIPLGVAFGIFIVYHAYHRITIRWDNSLFIAENPVNVQYYYVKKTGLLLNVIYLQTDQKLWILIPGTSQDNTKFKDFTLLRKEQQENERNVDRLQSNLINDGIKEKKFAFLTPYIKFSVIALLISFAMAFAVICFP